MLTQEHVALGKIRFCMTKPTTQIKVCTYLPEHLRPYEIHDVENMDRIEESSHKYEFNV